VSKCCTVSSSWSHSGQRSRWSSPWWDKRSAVQQQFKEANQTKNLHRGGAQAFHISLHVPNFTDPTKKWWLADFVVNSPDKDGIHICWSSIAGVSSKLIRRYQSWRYSDDANADSPPLMPRTQVLSPTASFTVLRLAILFLTDAQRVGARSGTWSTLGWCRYPSASKCICSVVGKLFFRVTSGLTSCLTWVRNWLQFHYYFYTIIILKQQGWLFFLINIDLKKLQQHWRLHCYLRNTRVLQSFHN